MISYVLERVDRITMVPGGWSKATFRAADAGTISEHTRRRMLVDYLTPLFDTTISATSAALELFTSHPDQWDKLRADPSLISAGQVDSEGRWKLVADVDEYYLGRVAVGQSAGVRSTTSYASSLQSRLSPDCW